MANKVTTMHYIRRPAGRNNFPLVDFFCYTGEADNPYRCSSCVTAKQHQAALRSPSPLPELPPAKCCRKCGMDFYR